VTIVGTVLAAAGLNLGVLGLVAPNTTAEHGAEDSAPADPVAVSAEATAPINPEGLAQVEGETEDQVVALPLPEPADSAGSAPADETTPGSSDESSPDESVSSTARPGSQASVTAAQTAPQSSASGNDRSATTSAPTTAAPSARAPSTAAPTQQPSSTEFLTYELEGVATIIIALHDGDTLEFWSVARQPGWVSRVDDNKPTIVKVKFMRLSDGEEAEFVVKFDEDDRDELIVEMEH
jgi:hypothetical protein